MSRSLQAVIFDLDGLILDSETPDYLSWKEVYARHGLDLTVQDWAGVVGPRDIDLYAPLRTRNRQTRSRHLPCGGFTAWG